MHRIKHLTEQLDRILKQFESFESVKTNRKTKNKNNDKEGKYVLYTYANDGSGDCIRIEYFNDKDEAYDKWEEIYENPNKEEITVLGYVKNGKIYGEPDDKFIGRVTDVNESFDDSWYPKYTVTIGDEYSGSIDEPYEYENLEDATEQYNILKDQVEYNQYVCLNKYIGDGSYEEVKNSELDESINEEEKFRYDGKIKIKQITKDEWDRTPNDYKMIKNGQKYILYLDKDTNATVLGRCEIISYD